MNDAKRSILYKRWINLLHTGVNIGDVLRSANISCIWIYGDGEICSMLIDDLLNTPISIKGIVVREHLIGKDKYKRIPIYSIDELSNNGRVYGDTIIVTPIDGFATIQNDLINVFEYKHILHISEVISNPPILISIQTKKYGEDEYCFNVCTEILNQN